MGVLKLLLILIFMCCFFEAELLNSANYTCHSDDLKALDGLRSVMKYELQGWGYNYSTNCCSWVGVTCDSSKATGSNETTNYGRVVKLELGGKKLAGNLSESIGGLEQLRFLNLSLNFIQNLIPMSLFQMPKLEVMDLSFNYFSGSVPKSIDLPSIKHVDLSQNSISGALPLGLFVNSSDLEILNLSFNSFSEPLPPELGRCSLLKQLELASNLIPGGLPDELSGLKSLTDMDIQNNNFSAPLNKVIGDLVNLVRLEISFNQFFGALPDVFYNTKNLIYFSAQFNRFTGSIPYSLTSSPSIMYLNLWKNSLSGGLNINCTALTSLVSLNVGSNGFNGSIPSNLPSCKKLRSLNLARTRFDGQLPESFKNFGSLSTLSLTNSSSINISSVFNILQNAQNLSTLILTFNFFGEELPANPNLRFRNLQTLIVANCRLKGTLPQWLSYSTKLQILDLSWNQLSGTIPGWIGEFPLMFYLDLSNNSFSGEIPKEITGLQGYIRKNNSMEKTPSLDFPILMKRNGTGLQYKGIGRLPPLLNLSINSLTGQIWPEFGNLKQIQVLDLKMNSLSGPIPSKLSGMVSLATLDLSHNNLSGTFPTSLESLSFLSKFSVAYNQLQGAIPSGGQFQTFPNSSFEGNNFCGIHDSCTSTDQGPLGPSNTSGKSKWGVIVGVMLGIALLVFIVVLITSQVWGGRMRDLAGENLYSHNYDSKESEYGLVVLFQKSNSYIQDKLSLEDILKSTNNFDEANIIGCGGFGLVYKATLPDGRKVAIKRLQSGDCGQMEREFEAEVETLSNAQHPNLVLLHGYCIYNEDRLLIYTYMENGSLDSWLHDNVDSQSSLDWDTRLQIAQGAARGLEYLHQYCQPHILHRDIKSSNILLDENFEAHLSDFGLARLIRPYETHVSTDLVGTLGYIPPEYGQSSVATYKGDVFSFGVVLLELLTGKRPIDICQPKGFRDLISWVAQMKQEGRGNDIFDPLIFDNQRAADMSRVLEIACLCISDAPKQRPSTQQIVSWLHKIN